MMAKKISKCLHGFQRRLFSDINTSQKYKATIASDVRNKVGECPIWDDYNNLLCWIDIEGKTFLTFDPNTNKTNEYELPNRSGSFGLCNIPHETGIYLFLFDNGPLFYNPYKEQIIGEYIFDFEPNIISRPNDGRVDRFGNMVFGGMEMDSDNSSTKDNNPEYLTNIYRINKDFSITKLIKNISCTNSICFNKSGDIMYYTDSLSKNCGIYRLNYLDTFNKDYNIIDNLNELPFINLNQNIGVPDGSCVDDLDGIWNAYIFNGEIIRYNSDGNITDIISTETKYPSCPTFGGNNLNTMYITSILNLENNKDQSLPYMGALYQCELPYKGIKENRFIGVPPELCY